MIRCERPGCGRTVEQTGRGRPPRFCCDTCRALAGRLREHHQRAIAAAEAIEAMPAAQLVRVLAGLSRAALAELESASSAASGGITAGRGSPAGSRGTRRRSSNSVATDDRPGGDAPWRA